MPHEIPKLQSQNLAIIDLETSGVNPFRNEVLSIAIVPLDLSKPSCEVYVRPGEIQWSPFARKNFDNFSSAWNAKAVPPAIAYDTIAQYHAQTFGKEPLTVIGHNVGFDVAFMRKLAHLAEKDELPGISHRALDTHTMLFLLYLKGELPSSALSSDGAFNYFGINIGPGERHTAMGDALATRKLVMILLEQLQIQVS